MSIRPEQPGDIDAVHRVNRQAFGREQEAALADRLRALPATQSLVAVADSHIVGHIFFSPVTLNGGEHAGMLGLGPVAVLPEYQRRGIGSQLVRQGLEQCGLAGGRAAVPPTGMPSCCSTRACSSWHRPWGQG